MRHLTEADYSHQPWKNGKGTTVELARADQDGEMLWRLSMATVAEDGPFSLFPGIERTLTVLSGPGFRLVGPGVALDCRPLDPVSFAGDVAVSAEGTDGQISTDFNVMTSRRLPLPKVSLISGPVTLPADGLICLFALEAAVLDQGRMACHDLVIAKTALTLLEGRALAVRIYGVPD